MVALYSRLSGLAAVVIVRDAKVRLPVADPPPRVDNPSRIENEPEREGEVPRGRLDE